MKQSAKVPRVKDMSSSARQAECCSCRVSCVPGQGEDRRMPSLLPTTRDTQVKASFLLPHAALRSSFCSISAKPCHRDVLTDLQDTHKEHTTLSSLQCAAGAANLHCLALLRSALQGRRKKTVSDLQLQSAKEHFSRQQMVIAFLSALTLRLMVCGL